MSIIREHLCALYGEALGAATFEKLQVHLIPSPDSQGRG